MEGRAVMVRKKTARPSLAVSKAADVNPAEPLPARDHDEQRVPLYEMAAIDEFGGTLREPRIVSLGSCRSGRSKFRNGDVLFAKITPCVQNGKSALANGIDGNLGFGSSEFYVLRTKASVLPEYLFFFVRQKSVVQAAVASFAGTSGRQRVPSSFWDTLQVPIPPVPVQERIVQILQKASEIYRKRQEALRLADAILPASFVAMFGDPNDNLDKVQWLPLGRIADIRSGVTKGRKLRAKNTVEVPYLRVANVQDGFLDLSEIKTIEVLPEDVEKYHLEDGDILMTEGGDPDKLGRGAIWRGQVEGCIHQNHVFRVRVNRDKLAPEYLAALMRTQYAKQYFLSCAKRSSNLASINSTQVKAFAVPLPPIKMQEKFVSAVEQWVQASQNLTAGLKDASGLFASMMKQAFAGQLTAEWEVANADWIDEQVILQERLPRLLLLEMIRQRAVRTEKAAQAAVLVTALMKYAFLFQMEGNGRRRLYHFIPYHYGPFAKQLYEDLQGLVRDGVVRVENDQDEEKTRVTLVDTAKADQMLAGVPEDLKADVASIVETYGDLDHRNLLKTVYKKYPAYAKNSRVKKKSEEP
jgi:type I restriction enzyme S subunit